MLYLGGVGRLADLLAGQSIGLRKDELDVVAVKLRRIEMRLVTPEPDSSSVVVPARASITAPMP